MGPTISNALQVALLDRRQVSPLLFYYRHCLWSHDKTNKSFYPILFQHQRPILKASVSLSIGEESRPVYRFSRVQQLDRGEGKRERQCFVFNTQSFGYREHFEQYVGVGIEEDELAQEQFSLQLRCTRFTPMCRLFLKGKKDMMKMRNILAKGTKTEFVEALNRHQRFAKKHNRAAYATRCVLVSRWNIACQKLIQFGTLNIFANTSHPVNDGNFEMGKSRQYFSLCIFLVRASSSSCGELHPRLLS